MEEIKNILLSLIANNENEYVEYKEAKNNFDFNELGRYFSALVMVQIFRENNMLGLYLALAIKIMNL